MKTLTLAFTSIILLGIHTAYANDLKLSSSPPGKDNTSANTVKHCISDSESICVKNTTGGEGTGVDWTTKGPGYEAKKDNKVMSGKDLKIDINEQNLNQMQGGQ